MAQFVAALVMGINAIRIGCDFPMWMQYSCCLYMLSFLVLFSNFYYKVRVLNKYRYMNFNHWSTLIGTSVHKCTSSLFRRSTGNHVCGRYFRHYFPFFYSRFSLFFCCLLFS